MGYTGLRSGKIHPFPPIQEPSWLPCLAHTFCVAPQPDSHFDQPWVLFSPYTAEVCPGISLARRLSKIVVVE
jgi:hypothetical protein